MGELLIQKVNNSEVRVARRVYTLAEFCAAYRMGRTKAFGLIKSGKLRALNDGYRNLIRTEDAEAWLKSCEHSYQK